MKERMYITKETIKPGMVLSVVKEAWVRRTPFSYYTYNPPTEVMRLVKGDLIMVLEPIMLDFDEQNRKTTTPVEHAERHYYTCGLKLLWRERVVYFLFGARGDEIINSVNVPIEIVNAYFNVVASVGISSP